MVKTAANGKKTCEKDFKSCNELSNDECKATDLDLDLGTNKRCVLFNGKCELHYNDCSDSDLDLESKCKNNIPNDYKNKCVWDSQKNQKCDSKERECNELITYSTKDETDYSNYSICHLLKHTSPKICFYNGKNCIEVYKQCEDYEGTDSTTCVNINPLTESGDGTYFLNKLNKCVLDTTCKTKKRVCTDYKNNEDENLGGRLDLTKDQTKGKTMCFLEKSLCKEIYVTCDDYNNLVEESQRRKEDCEAINPRDSTNKIIENDYKCVFKNVGRVNKCQREKKECKDFKTEETCNNNYVPEGNKKDIFKNGECKMEYINCDLYNDNVLEAQKKEEDCKSITPIYSDNIVYECVYKEGTGGNHICEKKKILCKDYNGQDEDYCRSLSASKTDFNCALINNKCIEQYKDCSTYSAYK